MLCVTGRLSAWWAGCAWRYGVAVLHGGRDGVRSPLRLSLRLSLTGSPLAGLLAGCMALPCSAWAADATTLPARHASGVVMMIGGMSRSADAAATPALAARVVKAGQASPEIIAAFDDLKPASVVILPSDALSADAMRPSRASAVSRVMALSPIIDEAAQLVQLDSALLMAVIDVESGGNSQAVSPKGATGLMQLMPGTGSRLGASDLFDPRQNIAAGARYLKALIGQFGDLTVALAAYNAGEGAVQKYGGQIPPYAETMSYVPKVIARYRWYRDATSSTGVAIVREVSGGGRGPFMTVGSGTGN